MVHYTWWFGSGFLGYCDFFGEKLAWALGITSPKYYYEIEDFKRQQEEEKAKLSVSFAYMPASLRAIFFRATCMIVDCLYNIIVGSII